MKKSELLALLKRKKDSEPIDLTGQNIEGLKSNLINIGKNEILYKKGSPSKSFYFVITGEVMVSEDDKINIYKEKEYFGLEELENSIKRKGKAIGATQSVILEFIIHDTSPLSSKDIIPKISVNNPTSASQVQPVLSEESSITRDHSVDFDSVEHEGILIIYVNISKATLASSKPFLNHINNDIANGHKNFVIDLRKCTIIDSTFLGSLVKSLRNLTGIGGKIVLVYNKDSQSTLFMITYMDKVFQTFDSVEQALAYLNAN